MVLLVQPSYAAAERVFLLLSNTFTERQRSSVEDYIYNDPITAKRTDLIFRIIVTFFGIITTCFGIIGAFIGNKRIE